MVAVAESPPPPWGGGGFEGALASEKTGAGTDRYPPPNPLPKGEGAISNVHNSSPREGEVPRHEAEGVSPFVGTNPHPSRHVGTTSPCKQGEVTQQSPSYGAGSVSSSEQPPHPNPLPLDSGGEGAKSSPSDPPLSWGVGVDIEFIQPDLLTPTWVNSVMTPEEVERITEVGPEEFFRLWTRKEAVAKALNCEGITLEDFGRFSVLTDQIQLNGDCIEIRSFDVGEKHSAAVAWVTGRAETTSHPPFGRRLEPS